MPDGLSAVQGGVVLVRLHLLAYVFEFYSCLNPGSFAYTCINALWLRSYVCVTYMYLPNNSFSSPLNSYYYSPYFIVLVISVGVAYQLH